MKILSALVLYTCLMLGANAASADLAAIAEMREGDMKKLVIHAGPRDVSQTPFETVGGDSGTLADYRGKIVVLNFWATWCAPCKAEMPGLQALQDTLGAEGLEVVTIAFGRHNPMQMKRFWDAAGITSLPLHLDPGTELARAFGVKGLPHSFVLNPAGEVIADLPGEADWAAAETVSLLRSILAD